MNHITNKIETLKAKVEDLQQSIKVDKMRKEQAEKDIKFSERLIREYSKYIDDLSNTQEIDKLETLKGRKEDADSQQNTKEG